MLGSRTGHGCGRRISEDHRPQRHRLELLDGSLGASGLARANALQSRTLQGADADAARVRVLAAYKDFFSLWKDADPDIPILKEAKAEYGKPQ
ncbi:MAG: hypothetical protein WCA20_23020 [Candidatus Sulfotelmatobacter sp.]